MEKSPALGRWAFALTGLIAALVGMAVGHVVAGLVLPEASPVLAVGSNVIDATPQSLKQWAIRQFGNDDKTVLIGSVVAVTLVLALVAGVAGRKRRWIGLAFVGVLGLAVITAALRSSSAATAADIPAATVLPGMAATLSAGVMFLGLRRLALDSAATGVSAISPGESGLDSAETRAVGDADAPTDSPTESPTDHRAEGASRPGETARRQFLGGAAGALAGSALLGAIGQRLSAPEPVSDLGELKISSRAPALPRGLDAKVPGITPFRTANKDFYRVDTALVVPRVNRGSWTLTVDGDVEEELEFSFDDLVALPLIERDVTLNCVSNEVGGPYISSGRWIGVRTRDILRRAGLKRGVEQILSRSVDGMSISTPIQALTDDRDAMIAIGLNGEALPRKRGYPARLITPGLYGFVGATKWLSSLTATTYAADRAYWTERRWATDAPVLTQSRIDTPASFDRVRIGTVKVGGVAWAQRRGIERVEIQVDGGQWRDAVLGPEANVYYWRQWYALVALDEPGRHDIRVRATSGDGVVQTEDRATPFPSGATGLHSLSITAE